MNTTSKGDAFERRVYDYFRAQIEDEQFHVRSSCCKVFHKKGYYSRDRDSEIEFDVSIEVYLPGATEYSEVWLIECKNYSHSVPVNDVEEFFAKVQQVSPTSAKPVMASNAAFQSGALNFAKAKKIGVLRLFSTSDVKWELYRSPSASAMTALEGASERILEGLTSQQFDGGAFDLHMQSPTGATNSLWDFADGMLVHSRLSAEQRRAVANPRGRPSCRVPYIGNDELEDKCLRILREISWAGGEVSLEDICSLEQTRSGLQVRTEAFPEGGKMRQSALGRISFSPLEILVYRQLAPNFGRERFTLAHELAHHLLSHGKYMSGESCDESDFKLKCDANSMSPDIVRMEYQANVFAACLLMPKTFFVADFKRIAEWLHIPNRGHGALYLDGQPCNYQNYERVTRELMSRYGVSHVAATIRLESLGLLRDVRPQAYTL